jgi:trans-2,3-dihydro-3-hydroxyanthranilate isomerase
MKYDIHWVEVFAEQPFGGNLLPVITGADGIADDVMALVARGFRQAETSFVQRASDGVSDYRHRIFMVTGEIPFAGHPSLGAAAVVAWLAGTPSARFVQQTRAGRQPLEVVLDGSTGRVTLTQDPADFGDSPDPTAVLAAIGIDPRRLRSDLTPQVVSTGLPSLIVPLAGIDDLIAARADRDRLRSALDALGDERPPTVYAVAESGPDRWRARAFVPDVPDGEDAATGSAAGPFGAFVAQYLGRRSIVIDQGIEMGSPSVLAVDTTDGIQVTGAVRFVGSGRHEIP